MPFTLVVFHETKDYATLDYVAAIPDQHVTVAGNDITVPGLNQIIAVLGSHATLERLRLESPSLRSLWLDEINPFVIGENLSDGHMGFCDKHLTPIALMTSEKLNALMEATTPAATHGTVGVFLADGVPIPMRGEVHTIRAVPVTAPVANVWTNSALTLSQTLPAGRYAVVGLRWIAADSKFARLVFVGGTWRPGCPGVDALEDPTPEIFRQGRLGNWGEFEFDQPPTVDLLSDGTTAGELYIDLIQVRSGR